MNPDPKSDGTAARAAPPLWAQLQAAAAVLAAVRAGRSATAALAEVAPNLRAGVQALVYAALRSLARAEFLRRQLARRSPPPRVDALLCLALALAWRDEGAPYAAHTLVDQAVEAAKRDATTQPQSGFMNACLRRFLREREALVALSERDPVVRWNHPAWWMDALRRDHPAHWEAVLAADSRPAPLQLRVNVRRQSVADYLRRLAEAGHAAQAVGPVGVQLARAVPVAELPGFADGDVSVQDAAAQRAALLLLDGLLRDSDAGSAPLRILDACAAPGGKTAHLLEASDAQVLALELDAVRARRIGETLQRLGLQDRATLRVGDAARPTDWWDGQAFDAILLDAPCTASGIVRRHPDVPWLRRPDDLSRLAQTQAALLQALWPLLRPGGRLLYCTCSVFRIEGSRQVDNFLARQSDARMLSSPGHLLPGASAVGGPLPDGSSGDHDGFFYALLVKQPA